MRTLRQALIVLAVAGLVVLGLLWLFTALAPSADAHRVDRRTTASWYQTAGLSGACGHALDGKSMASKWFACGSKVMVVRPNGRHVLMHVDDRCQCGADLDKEAARSIGITGTGKVALAKVHPGWRQDNSWAARWIRR